MDPIVSLQGRTIVVTGAGQGIGKGIAELAAGLGANVVAVDLNGETLAATVESNRVGLRRGDALEPQRLVGFLDGERLDLGLAARERALRHDQREDFFLAVAVL